MKEKTLKIVLIIVCSLAFVICMYAALSSFKKYLETGKTYALIFVTLDVLLAGVNAFNLGYNFFRWRMLDNQKQAIQRFVKIIEDKLNSDGFETKIELETQVIKDEKEEEKQ